MSIKATLAYGKNFHLYSECMDDQNVYLSLDHCEFEVFSNRCVLTIPLEIWETIRQHTNVDFSLADKTDEELHKIAEEYIKNRMEMIKESPGNKIIKLSGCMYYGDADDPIEKQINEGVKNLKEDRKKQRILLKKIKHVKASNCRK